MMDEREFELVNIIGAKLGSNQRDLSRHMELSLGMVNMLLRRLNSKGYIRINQLNKNKVEYILTSKGFSEKMRKSVKYTMKTISSIGLIKARLKEVSLQYCS
jgi:DNA-binding MarR family transcriptional regulator